MLCFRDKTFCPFNKDCWLGDVCYSALTDEVKKQAQEWWGKDDPPIAVFTEKPGCFKPVKK